MYEHVVDAFLSAEECEAVLSEIGEEAYREWLAYPKEYRNNKSVFVRSEALAKTVYARLVEKGVVVDAEESCGVSDEFCVSRYAKGEFFSPHCDGATIRDDAKSRYTVLVYLNDVDAAHGGRTLFYDTEEFNRYPEEAKEVDAVVAVRGRMLMFRHDAIHAGEEIRGDAVKYVLRTEVMYRC